MPKTYILKNDREFIAQSTVSKTDSMHVRTEDLRGVHLLIGVANSFKKINETESFPRVYGNSSA